MEVTIPISKLNDGENIIYVYAYDKVDNYSIANVKINVIKNGGYCAEVNLNPVANPVGHIPQIGEVITLMAPGLGYRWNHSRIYLGFWDGTTATGSEARPAHIYNEA